MFETIFLDDADICHGYFNAYANEEYPFGPAPVYYGLQFKTKDDAMRYTNLEEVVYRIRVIPKAA